MNIQKVSISLSKQQYDFIETYQIEHHYKTRSEVIRDALYLLQQQQLEVCYREGKASQEIAQDFDIENYKTRIICNGIFHYPLRLKL